MTTLTEIRNLIANDAYAITFQTMGQYRTALLNAIDASTEALRSCPHDIEYRATMFDHVECTECGGVYTDSGGGIAKNTWFRSLYEAQFYQRNGRLPDPVKR